MTGLNPTETCHCCIMHSTINQSGLLLLLIAILQIQDGTQGSPASYNNQEKLLPTKLPKNTLDDPNQPLVKNDNKDLSSEKLQPMSIKKLGNSSIKSEAWNNVNDVKWSSRYIPYESSVSVELHESFQKALKTLEEFTCLHFIKRDKETDYIEFVKTKDTCESSVGSHGGGRQTVNLDRDCNVVGTILHEIMHKLGRHHEHQRPDRDEHVEVKRNCIEKGKFKNNFKRLKNSGGKMDVVDTQKIPYDYLSLMHYRRGEFAKGSSNCKETIVPAGRIKHEVRMGQEQQLTMYDALHINMRYCPELMVRLVGGKGIHEGRIEVFWNGQWGTVCGDNFFDENDANVICQYLGFPGVEENEKGKNLFFRKTQHRFGRGFGPVWFGKMKCDGDEPTPYHCPKKITPRKCRHNMDASVICKKNIRLADGKNDKEGRVETYRDNVWGSICASEFGMKEATVICRQLGLKYKKFFKDNTKFGEGTTGRLVLVDVECTGEEEQLRHCKRGTILSLSCKRYVGVRCV